MFAHVLSEFLKTVMDVLPYFIGAVLFSALLETKLNSDALLAPFIRGRFAIIWASILGGILPGCACATVPLAENLRQKKAGLGVISAFLLVSPLVSPHTIILTYGFLGLKFAVWRVVSSMIGAIVLGYFLHMCERKQWIHMPSFQKKSGCSSSECANDSVHKPTFFQSFWGTTKKLGGYFVLGVFIAAVLTVAIPTHSISTYIGTGLFAYFIAAIIGIPIYVCEGEEIPITRALLGLQLGVGPAFTFMMGAVGTCIPTMLMARKIIGNRAILIYSFYWFVFSIVSGYLFSLLVNILI
jgi:uncharacterized protein